jgi:hypothetical protein
MRKRDRREGGIREELEVLTRSQRPQDSAGRWELEETEEGKGVIDDQGSSSRWDP